MRNYFERIVLLCFFIQGGCEALAEVEWELIGGLGGAIMGSRCLGPISSGGDSE